MEYVRISQPMTLTRMLRKLAQGGMPLIFLQFTPLAIWRGCKGHSSSIATTHNFEENFFTEEPCFIPLDV